MPEEDPLTPEERQELMSYMGMNFPKQEEKVGVFHFFNKVLALTDTSKAGNLNEEELNSVRNLSRAKLFAKEMDYDKVAEYIQKRAEIILATSLSKDAKLIEAVITTKKEAKTKIKTSEGKTKWLKKKEEE